MSQLLSAVEIGLEFSRWNPELTVRQAYIFATYFLKAHEADFTDLADLILEIVENPPACPLKETIAFFKAELAEFLLK